MDARAPPFSLLEFGDLVSAALASPDIPPLATALPVPRESTATPTATKTRRSLLSRVKHALVSLRFPPSTTHPRRAASEPAPEPPHRRARSPAYRIPELQRLSSFNAFDTSNPKDASAFEPAVPLVMQYERVYGLSVPSLPSYASYSSPSSSAYFDSSPPSSTSSCTSSGSSYPPTPSILSPVFESSSEDACTSRWPLASSAFSDAEPVFLTKPTQTPTPTLTLRRRRTRLSLGLGLRLGLLPPAKPLPVCPLPPLPSHASLLPFSQPSFDAFSSPSAFSHVASRHTFTAPTPTPTAHPDQRPSKSLRSVRSLPFSLSRSPLHDEDTRSLTTRARPSARSGRRAPVPSLLDVFPVPPSSVPSSPYSSPSKSVKSASSSPSKRPSSPFPFTRPISISIPGAYPPSPPRFFRFSDDDDFDTQDDGKPQEEEGSAEVGAEGDRGEEVEVEEDIFHSACSDAF
ncbi:hypothetical protein C8R46DRAFT_1228742 [Mycena filopes]|nr:hypothetical protein C8R46DRAFT_1228742 [Mycena filopes]